ncbi:hypothetical protein [Paraburkholderia phenoliruptrix]|uniref:hypothetical protein n=1 Tax=Paraburkholderia phenoliruptrix TaxID=252970 RepID=UPI0028699209|nr:hypothetical protein [Paraburkholderia phenoliruptrix]WMY11315.1 hypothetical protein P3F88_32215 [Paraburkholderia phenoliruptrix]
MDIKLREIDMVREEQLSLCFEPLADDVQQASSTLNSQQQPARVLSLTHFKKRRPAADDANSVRLLEKIARKVKYF